MCSQGYVAVLDMFLGNVTSLGYITIWKVSSLGYVVSGICYGLGFTLHYSLGFVKSGLHQQSYVVVWVGLQS